MQPETVDHACSLSSLKQPLFCNRKKLTLASHSVESDTSRVQLWEPWGTCLGVLPPLGSVDPAARRTMATLWLCIQENIRAFSYQRGHCSTLWLPWVLARILEGRKVCLGWFGGSPLHSPSPLNFWGHAHSTQTALRPLPRLLPQGRAVSQCLSTQSECKARMLPSHMDCLLATGQRHARDTR